MLIKECKVILDNGLNMVIDFNGVKVQMPSVNTKEKTIFIELEKEKYIVATKDDYEKSLMAPIKKTTVKIEKEIGNIIEKSTDEE